MATPLSQRQIMVTTQDGKSAPAVLMGCTCGGEKFFSYIVQGGHQHLQCTSCGESYCDGACALHSPVAAETIDFPPGLLPSLGYEED
jgi:hypothetical protein